MSVMALTCTSAAMAWCEQPCLSRLASAPRTSSLTGSTRWRSRLGEWSCYCADGRTPAQTVEALFNIQTSITSLYGRPNWTHDEFADDPGFLGDKSSTFKWINKTRAADTLTFGNITDTDAFGGL